MISNITASIGMACLGTGLVPGLGIIRYCNILLQRILLPRFSNVVKRIKSTHSEPTKANNETRQYFNLGGGSNSSFFYMNHPGVDVLRRLLLFLLMTTYSGLSRDLVKYVSLDEDKIIEVKF